MKTKSKEIFIRVLSLFDGMSVGRLVLKRLNIEVKAYYASETDKAAMKVANHNFQDTVQLGDVQNWQQWGLEWKNINLVMGGSPCQGFSVAGKGRNFDDPRSKLLFVFLDILNHIKAVNPSVIFLLENVMMKRDWMETINRLIGVDAVKVNSSLVSAQSRNRLYWSNLDITQPTDRHIYLCDILQDESQITPKYYISEKHYAFIQKRHYTRKGMSKIDPDKAVCMTARQYADWNGTYVTGAAIRGRNGRQTLEVRKDNKSNCLTSVGKDSVVYSEAWQEHLVRRLTPVECERLQSLPDNYTAAVSDSQRYKMLGNGWQAATIEHILMPLSRVKYD